MENKINDILKQKNIVFERQKRFDWLGLQSLDFYLPKYNIAIECQGEQHFYEVKFGGDKTNKRNFFENIKKLDLRKLKLCNENCIKIFYINYFDNFFDKLNLILDEVESPKESNC